MPETLPAQSAARFTNGPLLPARPFLWLTAGLLPLCALCIPLLDQPVVRFCHASLGGLRYFFAEFTGLMEVAYDVALKTRLWRLPALFVGLIGAYALGRWLKQPRALVFVVLLLVHLASVGTSNVLKGTVRRLRPEVLLNGPGYSDLGFFYPHSAHPDSFPSTHTATYFSLFLPLALAFPRWRIPLLIIPVLIGLGRLVLGAHYPSDVLFSVWLVVFYTFLFGQLFRLPWLTGSQLAPPPATASSAP